METAILIALVTLALCFIVPACHQYFFKDSFFNDDEESDHDRNRSV